MAIRDMSYKPYAGPRLPITGRSFVFASRTLALMWRSGLVKTMLILAMLPLLVSAVVLYYKVQLIQQLGAVASFGRPEHVTGQSGDPLHTIFSCIYWSQIWFVYAVTLGTAAATIAEDRRTGALILYLSRPLRRSQYLIAKVAASGVLTSICTLVPGVVLVTVLAGLYLSGDSASVARVGEVLRAFVSVLVYSLTTVAAFVLPALTVSAFSGRAGNAIGLWSALFFGSWVLGDTLASAGDLPYMALISLSTDVRIIGQHLFGITPDFGLPWYAPAATIAAVATGCGYLLFRRLHHVEVVG